jgi:VWFA-related protein
VRPFITILLLLALVPPPAFSQQPAPPASPTQEDIPSIRRVVELVTVVATVLNRRQKFITDLQQENFKISEDGRAQQIRYFSRATDLPLRVGLLLDTSNSIRDRLKFEQEAAIDFFHNAIRRKKDLAFLMTFDNEPAVIQDFTDDLATLTEAVLRQRAGGGTALYDAIYYACRERLISPPLPSAENPEVRRVLVVISDGEDTIVSGHALSDAVQVAQRAEVAIYTISTSTDWLSVSSESHEKLHKTAGDKVLSQLAEETGGRAFFPYRIDDLAQSFLDIGDELRSQYSLGYVPTNRLADGKFRSIRVEVDRKGLIVRARKGYYAPLPASGGPARLGRASAGHTTPQLPRFTPTHVGASFSLPSYRANKSRRLHELPNDSCSSCAISGHKVPPDRTSCQEAAHARAGSPS